MTLQKNCQVYLVAIAAFLSAATANAGDNVVIVLDDSGSMNERMGGGVRRIDAAKSAIVQVLRQFPDDTKLGLMLLNGDRTKEHWAIPLEHLSVVQATRKVESVKADGGTPLGDRIREGADALLRLREKQLYGSYRLLIVTDGEASDKLLLELYLPDVLARGLIVDAIGVDMKKNHSLATRVHSYRRADDAAALSKAIEEVFAEKIDTGSSNTQADFALLEAIDDQTAKEALGALSKPNNSAIVGVSAKPAKEAISIGATGNSATTPSNSPNANPVFVPSTPSNTTVGTSILTTIAITMASCMLPLLVVIIAIAIAITKANGGPNRSRR
jgi:hypothetical protein